MRIVPVEGFMPTEWKGSSLVALRRLLEPRLVRMYNQALEAAARALQPHLFFVFKGRYVTARTIKAIQALGATAVNVYPDVSFLAHGEYLPRALPAYDWIFQTKTFGVADLDRLLGVRRTSFLPHGYDPEVHHPIVLDAHDRSVYACDVSFVGTWSPKKQLWLEKVSQLLPAASLRIWGDQWESARATLGANVQGRAIFGLEYSKALVASRVNLGILSEARKGASSGDRITSRTFHIPATGAFMLHERTRELLQYFREGTDCGCFSTPDELVEQIKYFLAGDEERESIAAAGRKRVVEDGHSVDCRAAAVLTKVWDLRTAKAS